MSKNNCNDNTPYCTVHTDFIEAVQDLKTSVRWIVMIGGGLCTLGLALITMQYSQWQSAEKVHAQVLVNHTVLEKHIEDGLRHGI
jgi:hypothetical protein